MDGDSNMRTITQIIPGNAPPNSIPVDNGMGNVPVSVPQGVKFNPALASPSDTTQTPTSNIRNITQIIPGSAPDSSQSQIPLINRLGWPQGNQSALSKTATVLKGSAQDAQSLLTGILNNYQAIYNTPHAIANWIDPSIAQNVPSNNTNLGNLVSNSTGIQNSNAPLNNALVRVGETLQPAEGLAKLGGSAIGAAGNWLNSIPKELQLQKISDEAPIPGLTPEPVTTPVDPNYLNAVANSTESENSLNKISEASQSLIPKIYKQQVNASTAGMGNISDYLTANRALATEQSANMMNAYQQYGDEIPTHLQPQESVASLSPGIPLKGVGFPSPQNIIDNWDNLTPTQQQLYKINGTVIENPASQTTNLQQIQNWLGDDFDAVKSAGGEAFKKVVANPSIGNNYNLARMVGESATAASKNGTATNLYGLQSKILNEGVLNPLQQLDDINGTNTSSTVQQGRQLFKTNVVPYRANSTLDSISSGNFQDAEPSEVVNAIVKGQRSGDIPQDHFLSTSLPDFQNLAKYKSTPALTQITEGRGNLNPDQLTNALNSASDKGLISDSHPFSQIQKTMNKVNSSKNIADQNLLDQEALQNSQAQKNSLTNKENMENYNTLNRSNLQKYKENIDNINYNNALKMKQINQLRRQKIKRAIPAAGRMAAGLTGLHFLNHLSDFFLILKLNKTK